MRTKRYTQMHVVPKKRHTKNKAIMFFISKKAHVNKQVNGKIPQGIDIYAL